MNASTGQVAAQKRRTARSQRFLIRLGILCAALVAAFLAGTAAAQADDAEPGPVPNRESSPEPSPEDGGIVEDEGGKPLPPKQPSLIDLADVPGTALAASEIVAEVAVVVEEVPAAGVAAPVVAAVAHAVREVAATSDTALGGPPEDGAGTEVPAPQVPAPQAPAPHAPDHQSPVEPAVPSAVGEPPLRQVVPVLSELSRRAARTPVGSGAADLRVESDRATHVEAPAAISSDLGSGTPRSELLAGDHGVVGGGASVAADHTTYDSTCFSDRAGLVSDPVHTDTRPHSEPVARPGFAPD